jgi:hypothetical protein
MPWYAVRSVLRHSHDQRLYEERITLWQAPSFDDAVSRAESESSEYGAMVGSESLGLSQAFEIAEDQVREGTEVFSLIRESELSPSDYLDTFFDTGTERQRGA